MNTFVKAVEENWGHGSRGPEFLVMQVAVRKLKIPHRLQYA
jgi:hypothetical protein